jgi:hypothetical protein
MAYKFPTKIMKKPNYSLNLLAICLFCIACSLSSCGGGSSSSSSEGYGEYHNVNTGERQSSYKGSVEQQNDIATLDKMIEDGY